MPFQVHYRPDRQLVEVVIDGKLDLTIARDVLAVTSATVARHGARLILADVRQVEEHLSATDVYVISTEWVESNIGPEVRVAVVNTPGQGFDQVVFLQELASHRGRTLRQFEEMEEALRWLTDGRTD